MLKPVSELLDSGGFGRAPRARNLGFLGTVWPLELIAPWALIVFVV